MKVRRVLPALLLLASCAAAVTPAGAPMPGPAPARALADAARRNAECEGCHAEIAGEWRASLHHASQTEPAYQRAFLIEPLPFCQGCHAPEADPRAPVPPALADLGTGCVTCHVTGTGAVLAAPSRKDAAAPAPHPITREPRFATAEACARCHEFAFPDNDLRQTPALMQSTIREHAALGPGAPSCADCHMPPTRGPGAPHRDHGFANAADPAALRAALTARATREGPATLRLVLSAGAVGHAFPTGDLFRRITVRAEAVGPEQQSLGEASRHLMRHFKLERQKGGAVARVLARDDRLLASGEGTRTAVLELDLGPAAAGAPIAWSVTYERVEHPVSEREDDVIVGSAVVLAEGTLP